MWWRGRADGFASFQAFFQLPEVTGTRLDCHHEDSWELATRASGVPLSQSTSAVAACVTDTNSTRMFTRDATMTWTTPPPLPAEEGEEDDTASSLFSRCCRIGGAASTTPASVDEGVDQRGLLDSESLEEQRPGITVDTGSRLTLSVSRGELVSDCLCVDSRQFPRRLMRLVLCPRRVRVEHRSRSWVPWAVASPPSSRVCWAR